MIEDSNIISVTWSDVCKHRHMALVTQISRKLVGQPISDQRGIFDTCRRCATGVIFVSCVMFVEESTSQPGILGDLATVHGSMAAPNAVSCIHWILW